ncbi:hypothetical protein SK128_016007 [Halocaridina rubra]|uniref:FLYWCH-type domain-containing protein n=1 Tax=Halocaridina rubra TaxID=373956 RepID=A0AAN9AGM1_HALRR
MNEECETAEELTPKVIKPDCNQTKHLSIQKGKIVEQKLKSSQSVVLKVKRGNKTQTLKEKCKEEERVCNDYNEDGRFGVEKHDNGSQRRKNDLVGKLLSVDSLLDEFQETLEVKHAEHGKDSESFKFSIIKKCILCGNLMLADNRGYIYNKGVTRQNETIWWCAFRDDNSICQASALQQGESFQLRPTPHCHEPTSGKKAKWQDEDQCCETAKDDISEPSVSLRKLDSNLSKKDKEMQNSLMRGKITAKEKTKEEKANEAGFLPAAKLGIVEGLFSTHGRPKIVDTKGYSYTMKVNGVYRKVWRCSVRNKSMSCNVHITQKGNLYKYSSNQHCHDPKPLPDPNRKKRKKSSSEKIDWKPEPKIKTENYPDLYPLIESQVLNIVSSSGSVEHAAETVKPLTAIVEPMSSEVLEGLNIRSEVVTILENGSKKGRSLLVDPQGYTYTLRRDRGNKIYWACSVRNSKLHCGACMIQTGEIFSRGKKEHLHAPKPLKLKIGGINSSGHIFTIVTHDTGSMGINRYTIIRGEFRNLWRSSFICLFGILAGEPWRGFCLLGDYLISQHYTQNAPIFSMFTNDSPAVVCLRLPLA